MTPVKNAKSEQVAVRLPHDLIERIDALAAPLSQPGLELGRATVVRMAVAEGVEVLEKRAAETKRRK